MNRAPERCPKCGSSNIIGYKGEYECMDCGYKFTISAPKKPAPPSPRYVSKATELRGTGGRRIGLIAIIIVLIAGTIIGYGLSYVSAPMKTEIKTSVKELVTTQEVTKVITTTSHETITKTFHKTVTNLVEVTLTTTQLYTTTTSAITEWIPEDNRIKLSTRLIPHELLGEVLYYTIEVSVTNIATEPLKEVWVFVFPYQGESLVEKWNPLMYCKEFENLMPGETNSYNFTMIPKDITSYRVFAIAS